MLFIFHLHRIPNQTARCQLQSVRNLLWYFVAHNVTDDNVNPMSSCNAIVHWCVGWDLTVMCTYTVLRCILCDVALLYLYSVMTHTLWCRAAVLLALGFGVMLSPCYHITASVLWWIIGFASYIALYLLPTWQAFAGKKPSIVPSDCCF